MGCCISIAEGRIGPSVSDIPEYEICKYKLYLDMKIREMPNYSTCLGKCSFLCAQKQPIKSSGEALPLKIVYDSFGDYL